MPSNRGSDLQKRIKARAKVWAANITKDANKASGKPKHIKVKSQVVDNNGKIDVVSTGSSPKGDARAYEFGSGIRSRSTKRSRYQMGSKGFIRIAPKRKKVLAFFWDKVDKTTPAGKKFRGVSSQGKALFNYVEHPGVQAAGNGKGYLSPAISKVRKQIRIEVPKEIREEVAGSLRRAFKK